VRTSNATTRKLFAEPALCLESSPFVVSARRASTEDPVGIYVE
jgi:hypothetical protein